MIRSLADFAPWHCWRQHHSWIRCLLRGGPHGMTGKWS